MLLLNDYPNDFIDKYVFKRLSIINSNLKTINLKKPLMILPYFKDFHYNIKKLSFTHNFEVIFKCINKFSVFITLGKDPISIMDRNNIVYKIDCNDCNSCYIGQSSRYLKIRVNEHKRDCKNKNEKSALGEHTIDTDHSFNFDKVQILDIENNKYKRLFQKCFISI